MQDLFSILRQIQKMCTNRQYCITFEDKENIACPLYDHNDGYCIFTDCPEQWTLKENKDQIKTYERGKE